MFFVDAGNNRIGIGTASPTSNALLSVNGRCHVDTTLTFGSNSTLDSAVQATIYKPDTNMLAFATAGNNERMRIDNSGRLLLGTSTARAVGGESNPRLHIEGSGNTSNSWVNLTRFQAGTAGANFQFAKARSNTPGTYTVVQSGDTLGTISFLGADGTDMANYAARISAQVDGTPGSNDMPGRLVFSTTADGSGTTTERMRIDSSGNVGIGTASPNEKLHVSGTTRVTQLLVNSSGVHNSARVTIKGNTTGSHSNIQCQNSDGTQLFLVRNDNAAFFGGSVSKGSGSFFIDHPLPSLAATKTLRHSFIEGPQCDNIYRGKVTLSSGTASINIDTVAKMTEGTFVVLNRDIQCFTSNETSFTGVKGSVSGNILTITSEDNSSTDTISWMVVGERQDPNIKASTITDDDGYLLVEEDKVAV